MRVCVRCLSWKLAFVCIPDFYCLCAAEVAADGVSLPFLLI